MSPDYREQCAERDGHQCVRCGRHVSDYWPGFSCHHRQTRSVGPDTLDNRITLCGSGTTGCHGWVHANPMESRLNGWIVSRHLDSALIAGEPVTHWLYGRVCFDADGGFTIVELPTVTHTSVLYW